MVPSPYLCSSSLQPFAIASELVALMAIHTLRIPRHMSSKRNSPLNFRINVELSTWHLMWIHNKHLRVNICKTTALIAAKYALPAIFPAAIDGYSILSGTEPDLSHRANHNSAVAFTRGAQSFRKCCCLCHENIFIVQPNISTYTRTKVIIILDYSIFTITGLPCIHPCYQ